MSMTKQIALFLLCVCACAHPSVVTAMQPTKAAQRAPLLPTPTSPVVSPSWDLPELFRALNAQRLDNGASPLRIDRGLCAVAERANAEYQRLGRGAEQRVLGLINQDLQGFGLSFSQTRAAVVVVEEVREAPGLLEAALDPTMAYAGLFVAPAPRPVGPRGGYAVVLALGK